MVVKEGLHIKYKVTFSKRKTLGIMVDRNSSVVVKAPEGTSLAKIESIVESKKFWIYSKINNSQKYKILPQKQFLSGEGFMYLGKKYKLDFKELKTEKLQFKNKFIVNSEFKEKAPELVKEWYRTKAKEKITQRVNYYAQYLNVNPNKIYISDLKYRWGSCSEKGNLNFNLHIIKAPVRIIDYIVVHEMAHLIERNHSKKFWDIVRAILPRYKNDIQWLKEYGQFLDADF